MKTNSTFLEQALFRASEVARAVTREMYPTEEEILDGIETIFEVNFIHQNLNSKLLNLCRWEFGL